MRLSDIPRITFWPYDLFGYMLPGATFLTGIALGNSRASTFLMSLWSSDKPANYILLAFLAYMAGNCISAISSLVIEAHLLQWTFKYPSARLFPSKKESARSLWGHVRHWIGWLGKRIAPNYCNAFPEDFQKSVRDTFKQVFDTDFASSRDRFWSTWSFISLHHPAAYRRGSHFVELYGFSRNTCMSFILIAALPIFSLPPFETWTPPTDLRNWVWPSLIAALFFFANYLKLIKRMDDEMYHAFIVAAKAPIAGDAEDDGA